MILIIDRVCLSGVKAADVLPGTFLNDSVVHCVRLLPRLVHIALGV